MLFNTVVFSAIAALAASVQAADSCSAGAIIGIQAVCGSGANDCGSGRCCLADQTCVPSGSSFACADPNLSPGETVTVNAGCYGTAGSTPTSSTSSGKPTSSTKSGSTKPSSASATHTSGALSDSASGTVSSTKIEVTLSSKSGPSETASETKTTGSYSSQGSPTGTGPGSYVTVTAASSSAKETKAPSYSSFIVTSVVSAPYTFTNGTVNYPVGSASGSGSAPKSTDKVVQSNSATSAFSSPQNSFAILISALAIAAFSL
ncbi:hypothetical protein EG327_007306 [Venturia inaequalis]|uniref:Uncharacterized protein n=1 Tax=Venturia inaequalis TaxID=5025 RepID=A0A8H3YYC7_VENIN|nr:hypothetical protein EG327_007306 [Venturia inaequalis]